MKRILGIIIFIISISFIFIIPEKVEAQTLRELKEELAEIIANKQKIEAERAATKRKVNEYNNEIVEAGKDIEKCEEDIEDSRLKIDELELEIVEKQEEIDELLRFMQVANGENVFLEYVFNATSFTDFIYRMTVVEQLSDYNDKLIDEMYEMIEENKQLQKDLEVKIKSLESQIKTFQKKLSTLNLSLDDLDDEKLTLAEEIKIAQDEVEFYESEGCELDEELSKCTDIPYSNGFTRPLVSGKVSSNFGYRTVNGKKGYHRGIDVAIPEWTKVYASAAGKVSVISARNSCGGNMVYIQHNIDGKKYTTVYMHLVAFNVKKNDYVNINTIIGYSGGGRTTQSYDDCTTGAHLHFGILEGWTTNRNNAKDPRNFLNFPAKGSRFYSRW